MPTYEVVYLTGAPAAGKSSLSRALRQLVQPLEFWEFGERLTAYLNSGSVTAISQEDLRRESARAAGPADIAAVDRMLIDWTSATRSSSHIVIDSHPVTKEHHGFRVTPYSLADFSRLQPTQIWMLYTRPEVAVERIRRDPGGRPLISEEEARMHTQLQASVAITYGMSVGVPVHLFDSERDPGELAAGLAQRFQK